ncbi:MAG: hypothetical protein HYS98_08860 [Deltaproteobacteria bacterium]|nr:hypothetical protein [Deltaproteobacteria bacterium]
MIESEEKLQEFLAALKSYFPANISFDLKYHRTENEYRIHIHTESKESIDLLCGEAEFIQSLQYILWLVYRKYNKDENPALLSVDANEIRKTYLLSLADKLAQQAIENNRPVTFLQPLNSFERRMVHLHLSDGKNVQTESVGEGRRKKIIISPRA